MTIQIPFKKGAPSAALALYFEENRVLMVQARRSGQNVQRLKQAAAELSGPLLSLPPETAAAELRKTLDAAGIKESRCVVVLPLRLVMNFQVAVPELSPEDRTAFLTTEAERNLPYDLEDLSVSTSLCRLPSGSQLATVAAVRLEQIAHLQNLLKAAGMRAVSFVPAIASVADAGSAAEVVLFFALRSVELAVFAGGGVAMLRSLESDVTAGGSVLAPDVIGRELRVSLGQLPDEFRTAAPVLRIVGAPGDARALAGALASRLSALGLRAEPAVRDESAPDPAFLAVAAWLRSQSGPFEFLPPKVSAWKQFAHTSSARKLAWAGGAVAAAALILAGAFFIQNWQLSQLRTRWTAMEPQVRELEDIQQQIRRFRPWFDASFRNLTILRKLTEAFPVEGVVSAKTVEIRNSSQVTCSGTARDNEALFRMLDQLRANKDVTDLKRDQVRGKNPVQFSFAFKIGEGGAAGEH